VPVFAEVTGYFDFSRESPSWFCLPRAACYTFHMTGLINKNRNHILYRGVTVFVLLTFTAGLLAVPAPGRWLKQHL
jgi:hypothetical protein